MSEQTMVRFSEEGIMTQWEQPATMLLDDPKLFLKHFDAPNMERHESEPVTHGSPIPLAKFDWACLMPANSESDLVQLINIGKDEHSNQPNFGFRMLCASAKSLWGGLDLHEVMLVPVVDGVPFPTGPFAGFGQAVHRFELVSPRGATEVTDLSHRFKKAL